MRKFVYFLIFAVVLLGSFFFIMKARAPKPAPPSRNEIWKSEGIPVQFGNVSLGDMERTVDVTGSINALDQGIISPKVSGRVSVVYMKAGDSIYAGQVFAVLDQSDALNMLKQAQMALEQAIGGRETAQAALSKAITGSRVTKIQTDAAIAQAQAGLVSARAQLEIAKQPTRSQERAVAENAVATAKAQMENAEVELKRAERLRDEGAVSQSVYDSANTIYISARNSYNSAVQQLNLIKEGGRTENINSAQSAVRSAEQILRQAKANASENLLRQEDIKSAQAALKNAKSAITSAKASVAIAQRNLADTYIKSQVSGRISERTVEPGQVVMPGSKLASVINMGSLYFQADLSEMDVQNVKKGQKVTLTVDALPNQTFTAYVDTVFPAAVVSNRKFPVRIRVNGNETSLKSGMYVRGTVITGMSYNALLVPKEAVDERRGTKMVFLAGKDNKVKRIDVQIVAENTEFSQIKQPTELKPGDKVVTTGRQSVDDGSSVRQDITAR